MGIISIESNASYNEVNFALKAALTAGIVNGSLNIDSNSKKILEESDLSVYLVGGRGTDAVQVIKGFAGFSNFIVNGGQFTPEALGCQFISLPAMLVIILYIIQLLQLINKNILT